jgi:hypothetical protein
MKRSTRDKGIVAILLITVILWSLIGVGLSIAFLATGSFLAVFFAAAFGVGAWWASRLMLEFHSGIEHDAPTRLLRSHRRHAKEN